MFFNILSLLILHAFFAAGALASRCDQNAATYDFQFGGIKGIVISDGPVVAKDNLFSVSDAALHNSYRANFRSATPLILQQNVVILDTTNAGRILVDPGAFNVQDMPLFKEGGKLFDNMKAAGIHPDTIDAVLITHAHPDHVAGIVDESGQKKFPNAEIFITRTEHQFWSADPVPNQSTTLSNETIVEFKDIYLRSVRPYGDKLHLVEDGGRPLPGVTFIPTPGHTAGHTAIEIVNNGSRIVVSGDTWLTKPDQLQNPDWGFSSENVRSEAFDSRLRLLGLVSRRRDLVLTYHEEFPGLGHVIKRGPMFDWVPSTPQISHGVRRSCPES